MSVDDILDRLRQRGDVDADAAWDDYREQVDAPSRRGFAERLYRRGLIDAATLGDLLTRENVEVTQIVEEDFDVSQALGLETVVADAPPEERADATVVADPPEEKRADATVIVDEPADEVGNQPARPGATFLLDDAADRDGVETAPPGATVLTGGTRQDDDAGTAAARTGYRLLGLLGEGSMGEVHLARDLRLRRQVAVKRTKDETARNRSALTRFFTEAQITSQLEHPHIVPVYGLEVGDIGSLAYAMKLVQGKEMAGLIQETREMYERDETIDEDHDLDARLEVFLKVCDAIAFAHSRGVIHRDLKPSNIMIGRYREVYVMDWGIARLMGDTGDAIDASVELVDPDGSPTATDRTRAGASVGTPVYMSPEQAAGKNSELDGRSDLYTLGLILQEVVTLERAIEGETLTDVILKAQAGERRPVRHFRRSVSVPRELEAIVDRATRVDPDERYESVEAFADDVRRYTHGDAVEASPDTPLQKVGRWIGNHRTATMGIIATALAIVLGAAATIGTLIYEQAQLTAAHARERQISSFLTEVSTRSHRIDSEFLRYEAELENLAGGARMVIAHAVPTTLDVFFPEDFSGDGNAPSDLTDSEYYERSISIDWPVSVVAAGVEPEQVMRELRRLAWLRDELREILVASAHADYQETPRDEQRQLLAIEGAPMHRAFVTLAEGAHVSYPGMGGFSEDYDPRDRPFYTLAEGTTDEVWANPYRDDHDRLVLTCARALYDEGGRFRGVAGFDVTMRYIFDNLLDLPELGYVREELLVDQAGVVMVEQFREDVEAGARTIELEETLPYPPVVEALGEGTAGYLELTGSEHLFAAYYPVTAVGWYYVVIADAESMLAGETEPSSEP